MKHEKFDPQKTWVTADLHLGHAKIVDFLDRPYRRPDGRPDVEAMDRALIGNFRLAGVEDDHDVFVIGDFAYRCHPRKLKDYFHALPGRLHLVPGNHDNAQTLKLPWASPVEKRREMWIGEDFVVLHHYALRTWQHAGRGAYHLFGHSHGRLPPLGNSMDVGVDVFGGRPVRMDDVKRRLKAWAEAERDHHGPGKEGRR